jgi:hypothetical protein
MKRRNLILAIVGIVLVVVAMAAVVIITRIQSWIAPVPLRISYATIQTTMPDGAACAGGRDERTGVAKEILNLETRTIYIAGGADPMPDEVWANFRFIIPLVQNSTRNLLFDESCFFRSPSATVDCVGDACFAFSEIVGYTWLELTTLVGNDCFPDEGGCRADVVDPGYVSINTIAKCHRLVFAGPVIYELADGQGNLYVMHATATGTPDLTGPTLPEGWTLTERTITEPLELLPFGGGSDCYYNVIRDNLVQSYHQYVYADDRFPSQ